MPQKPPQWPVAAAMVAPQYQPLWRGLVGHWIMWEGSGLIARDISGRGSHLTFTSGPVWSASQLGTAITFDGTNDHLLVADSPHLKNFAALTIAAWINPSASGGSSASRIAHKSRTATADDYALNYISTDKLQLRINTDGGQTLLNGLTTITPNTGWYHALGTWDGSEMSVFLNGVSDATPVARTGTLTDNNQPFAIGAHEGTQTNRAFNGKIVDVRIWDRVLTPAEIRSLYQDPFGSVRPVLRVAGRAPTPPIFTFVEDLGQVGIPWAVDAKDPGWEDELANVSDAELLDSIDVAHVTSTYIVGPS